MRMKAQRAAKFESLADQISFPNCCNADAHNENNVFRL